VVPQSEIQNPESEIERGLHVDEDLERVGPRCVGECRLGLVEGVASLDEAFEREIIRQEGVQALFEKPAARADNL